jgi:Ribosome biogenesis protein Nop16
MLVAIASSNTCSLCALQSKSYARWNPKPAFGDKRIARHWDVTKSYNENLAKMGLTSKPNDELDPKKSKAEVAMDDDKAAKVVKLFDVSKYVEAERRPRRPITKLEERYIVKCLAKHGTDYKAMVFDTKVNDYQHTEEKLQKWGEAYLAMSPSERRQEVPDKVKHLVEESE